ncbi:hypothetical protein AALC25_00680 [Lachnospiraceae bacterium 29-84]
MEKRELSYIEGNTVKQAQAAPKQRPEEAQQELGRKQRQEDRKKREANAALIRRNQERELRMSLGYVLFLIFAAILAAAVSGFYLKSRSELTANTKIVTSLESEEQQLKTDNDAKERKMEASVDLEDILKKAVGEYGMVYPAEDQIVYYDAEDPDYMQKYGEIPKD